MARDDIFRNTARRTGLPFEACKRIIMIYFDEIKNALIDGEKVFIKGFATFEVVTRAPRRGRDPQSGEVVVNPETKVLKCSFSEILKEEIKSY